MSLLAIDPGSHRSGWATEETYSVVENPSAQTVKAILEDQAPDVIVIEQMWHLDGPLVRNYYTWIIAAELLGITAVTVRPQDWQKHLGIVAPKELRNVKGSSKKEKARAYGERRKWIKSAVIESAKKIVKRDDVQEDEADAILILRWAQDAEKLGVLG